MPDIGDGDFTCEQLGRTYAGKLIVRPTPEPEFPPRRRAHARRRRPADPAAVGHPGADSDLASSLPRLHPDRGAGRDGRDGHHVADGVAGRRRHRPHARIEPGAARAGAAPRDRDRAMGAGPGVDPGDQRGADAQLRRPERSPRPPRRGRLAGRRLGAAARHPGLRLAALGRPGRDDDAKPAGKLVSHAAVPGHRDRDSCARSTGLEEWHVYFFQGAWANCQSTGNVVALPTAPAASVPAAGAQKMLLPDGVRVVLGFAPGSGLAGNLVRDTIIRP